MKANPNDTTRRSPSESALQAACDYIIQTILPRVSEQAQAAPERTETTSKQEYER
ncbi:hypothetical protein NDK47_05635 [Brevibacillus ruminantium]|uniref:Uncharacterized protein n=1 Tax=Brevibacillus ruminantium TaxID=2950604 RepID=A0ABY4WI12_9BACL|nr:hypothetical protein [Brevibacillus ruminantium]USG66780.1 hypothetical protein NDK47_05635 [Brevibacillus ruminantium]